jgi:hypothetical protein
MIDSLVDEDSYTIESASFNTRINTLDPSGSAQSILALNAFTASQYVSNSLFIQSSQTSSMRVLSSSYALTASFALNASATVDTGSLVTTSSFNSYTASAASGVSASINAATQSLSASLTTTINEISGKTGSYATTGSNTFNGNQNIIGSLTASKLEVNGVTDLNGVLDVSNDATFRGDVLIQSSGEQKLKMRSTSGGGVSQGFDLLIQTSSFIIRDETHNIDFFEFDYNSGSTDHTLKLEANRFELNSGSLGVSGSFTASLAEGYVWVGNASGKTTTVSTSSFGGGGTINTGSFATTGSNIFKNTQEIDLSATSSTIAIGIKGANEVVTDMYVDAGNFDTFNVLVSASAGIQLRDFNGVATVPFLSVETNGGNVSIPRTTNITGSLKISAGSLIASGNIIVSGAGTVAQILGDFNAKVNAPALSVGTTTLDTLFESTASGVTSQIDFTRLGAGPTGDLTAVRLQTLSGSDTSGDTLLSRITTGVNRHTSTQMTGSVVNTTISSTWATGSGGTRIAYTSQINANAQSASATLTLNAGNATNNFTQGTASISAGFIRIGSAQAHRIEVTGSTRFVGNTTITGSLNVSSSLVDDDGNFINGGVTIVGAVNGNAIAIKSGSFALTTPQGSGSFYSNCPITSSGLRINGVALVNDLIISGVFSGNSTLQVGANASVSGNLFVSGVADISSISASKGLSLTGSVPTIVSGNLSGSLVSTLTDIYPSTPQGNFIVTLTSASMATLLSGAGTNANTIYFVI